MPGSERSTDIVNDSCNAQMQFTNYSAFKEGWLIQLAGIPFNFANMYNKKQGLTGLEWT